MARLRIWTPGLLTDDAVGDPRCDADDARGSDCISQLFSEFADHEAPVRLAERFHERFVRHRRALVLSTRLGQLIPPDSSVLDVGCGDGAVGALLRAQRPDLSISGIDTLVRRDCAIPVNWFDGDSIPVTDHGVDIVVLADVLHHVDAPGRLLDECLRVARGAVILKDHLADGFGTLGLLRLMDRVGNARFGVASPGRYLTRKQWADTIAVRHCTVKFWSERIGLYPWPLSMVFDRRLHFVCVLAPESTRRSAGV